MSIVFQNFLDFSTFKRFHNILRSLTFKSVYFKHFFRVFLDVSPLKFCFQSSLYPSRFSSPRGLYLSTFSFLCYPPFPGVSALSWSIRPFLEYPPVPGVSALSWSIRPFLEYPPFPGVSALSWSLFRSVVPAQECF